MEKLIKKETIQENLSSLIFSLQQLQAEMTSEEIQNFKGLEKSFGEVQELVTEFDQNMEQAIRDAGKYCECGSGQVADREDRNEDFKCVSCLPTENEAA